MVKEKGIGYLVIACSRKEKGSKLLEKGHKARQKCGIICEVDGDLWHNVVLPEIFIDAGL